MKQSGAESKSPLDGTWKLVKRFTNQWKGHGVRHRCAV